MNLKEAFRYQSKLDSILSAAQQYLLYSDAGYNITKTHNISKVNSEAEDRVEIVEKTAKYGFDDVVKCMLLLIEERENVATAAFQAKAGLDFCVDAAVLSNKNRQNVHKYITMMLDRVKESKGVEKGTGYTFNMEGNQVPYFYDIDVEKAEAFDRQNIKSISKSLIESSDEISSKIDEAMVTTRVNFTPKYDMNDTFEDVMDLFISKTN